MFLFESFNVEHCGAQYIGIWLIMEYLFDRLSRVAFALIMGYY